MNQNGQQCTVQFGSQRLQIGLAQEDVAVKPWIVACNIKHYATLCEAGADVEMLKSGDRVLITQSAVVLEKLIGQFMFDRAADAPPAQ